MHLVTAAIGPILLLLALGRLVRQRVVNDPGFWRGLEILNYRIYTPALFVTSISGTEFTNVPIAALVLGLSAPVVGATLLGLPEPCVEVVAVEGRTLACGEYEPCARLLVRLGRSPRKRDAPSRVGSEVVAEFRRDALGQGDGSGLVALRQAEDQAVASEHLDLPPDLHNSAEEVDVLDREPKYLALA